MIDTGKLDDILEKYRYAVENRLSDDSKSVKLFKAVKTFQTNWNVNAVNFYEMIQTALPKDITHNDYLLNSNHFFAWDRIMDYAKNSPEPRNRLFRNLYDETSELSDRVKVFKDTAKSLEKYGAINPNTGRNYPHHQSSRSISIYLWLNTPEKYYIYKSETTKTVNEKLGSSYGFKNGRDAENIENCRKLYDEIRKHIHDNHQDLIQLVKEKINDPWFDDPDGQACFESALVNDLAYFIEKDSEQTVDPGREANHDPAPEENEDNRQETPDSGKAGDGGDTLESYNKDKFLGEVYISGEKYDELKNLLEHKLNMILYGPPGVGKTFMAKRLAYSIMGVKGDKRVKLIQFHQSYSYEDFIIGYKPNGDGGFDVKEGVFYKFCDDAKDHPDQKYYFIIDEINRGNISRIFGELMMLIEKDYRGEEHAVRFPIDDRKFYIPKNVYIIGMMNTADRSLAMLDYALRRRFAFVNVEPAFDSDGFKEYQSGLHSPAFNKLIDQIKSLNKSISEDSSLGDGFRIGHSYFCRLNEAECTADRLKEIVNCEILPLLKEYWFDKEKTYEKWRDNLQNAIKVGGNETESDSADEQPDSEREETSDTVEEQS